MKIRYFATLRLATRQAEENWKEPVETVGALLESLSRRYGPGFRRWVLDEGGELGQLAIVLVNGRDVRELGGLAAGLQAEDTVSIFPPVAGG